jgi:serine phosphatase RsbU (regulator of sigma subunit)
VLFENVRERLQQDEYATLTLIHYEASGRFTFAGAHADLLVLRAKTGAIEWLQTQGTWVAATRDLGDALQLAESQLELGDVLVLYTDGVTEAKNLSGELYGPERLAKSLKAANATSAEGLRDALVGDVKNWMSQQDDDIALVVVRRTPPPGSDPS